MRKLPGPGLCEAWHFLPPTASGQRCGAACGRGLTRKSLRLPRGLGSNREAPLSPAFLGSPGACFLGPTGPWVSMATAGARPGGGQPERGPGAPGACAAALLCSPLWRACSPSRCPPRCRGETPVKYSQGRPSAPLPCSTFFSPVLGSSRPPSTRLCQGFTFQIRLTVLFV